MTLIATLGLQDQYFLGSHTYGEPRPPENLPPPTAGEDFQGHLAELSAQITAAQTTNVRHPPVGVTKALNPFDGLPAQEALFHAFLQDELASEALPPGHGFELGEWGDTEELAVGKRMHRITLPRSVWEPRAIAWVKGLQAMTYLIEHLNEHVD